MNDILQQLLKEISDKELKDQEKTDPIQQEIDNDAAFLTRYKNEIHNAIAIRRHEKLFSSELSEREKALKLAKELLDLLR
mgnify:CR=1 FL=1